MAFQYIALIYLYISTVYTNPVTEVTTSLYDSTETTEPTSTLLPNVNTESVESSETVTTETDREVESVTVTDCSQCLDDKYLIHYYAQGCKPVLSQECNCPQKFDCSDANKINITYGKKECIYNGQTYRIGQTIPIRQSPCRVCQCGYGYDADYHSSGSSPFAALHCVTVECPEHFAVHPYPLAGLEADYAKIKDCYNVYEPDKCCSVNRVCPDDKQLANASVCDYGGKTYQIGQKIYPNEDPCKVCICDQHWDAGDPVSSGGCYRVQCNLELDSDFHAGCIPIYHEGTCCPIEYHCPSKSDADYARKSETRDKCFQTPDSGPCVGVFKRYYFDTRDGQCRSFVYGGCGGNENNFRDVDHCEEICAKTVIEKESDEIEDEIGANDTESNTIDDECTFDGLKYPIGARLDIRQKCVDCICRVPPTLTCIHRSCPRPPSPLRKCKATYRPSQCCPTYDCGYAEKEVVTGFDPQSCPTPLCAADCHFEEYPDRCPDCVCESAGMDELEVEEPVKPIQVKPVYESPIDV